MTLDGKAGDDAYLFRSTSSTSSHPLRPYVDWNTTTDKFSDATLPATLPAQAILEMASLDKSGGRGPGDPLTLSEHEPITSERASALVKSYAIALGLRFFTNALAQPFEVGKILAQVQWVPGEGVESENSARTSPNSEDRDFGAADDELSDEDEAAAYFQDLQAKHRPSAEPASKSSSRLDSEGYLIRGSVFDESTRPDWVMAIPDGGRVGVWESIRALSAMPSEGVASLWKGQLTSFIYDFLSQALTPVVETSLNAVFSLSDPLLIPLQHLERPLPNLLTLVAASTLVGCFLSPLDMVRTRLIVQARRPDRVHAGAQRKYTGPLTGLRLAIKEEGGIVPAIFAPIRFVPTVLYHMTTALLSNSIPLLIEREWRMNKSVSPIRYGLVEFCLHTAQLLVILPIEIVLRRLQVQKPPRRRVIEKEDVADGGFKACIELRPKTYTGFFDALYRITIEEGRRPKTMEQVRKTSSSKKSSVGIRGLYRGFGIGLSANLMVFVLGLATRDTENAGQWEEL